MGVAIVGRRPMRVRADEIGIPAHLVTRFAEQSIMPFRATANGFDVGGRASELNGHPEKVA